MAATSSTDLSRNRRATPISSPVRQLPSAKDQVNCVTHTADCDRSNSGGWKETSASANAGAFYCAGPGRDPAGAANAPRRPRSPVPCSRALWPSRDVATQPLAAIRQVPDIALWSGPRSRPAARRPPVPCSRAEVASLWPTARRRDVGTGATLGRDPAGAGPRPAVRPCRVHGGSRVRGPASRRGRLAAIWQPDAHTVGTACERQPLGLDPAGAAVPGPPFARASFTGVVDRGPGRSHDRPRL